MDHKTSVQWYFYPRSESCPAPLREVPEIFKKHHAEIDSTLNTGKDDAKKSNEVLAIVAQDLHDVAGFEVETGKTKAAKLTRPVLYGLNGQPTKTYDVDGWQPEIKAVLEVEAGAALANFKFLKALFESVVMDGVDYLVLAVPNWYYSNKTNDFEAISVWFDVAFASGRFTLPLKGILLTGY